MWGVALEVYKKKVYRTREEWDSLGGGNREKGKNFVTLHNILQLRKGKELKTTKMGREQGFPRNSQASKSTVKSLF